MIAPKDWIPFVSFEEKLNFLKDVGLVPNTYNYIRQTYYSGIYVDKPTICTIEGYSKPSALVIKIGDELHCINADYLTEMQIGLYRLPEEYIVFDLETTGLSPKKDSIVEFAGIKYVNGVEVDRFETLVNPNCEMSPMAEAVNGISAEMVCGAPCIEEIIDEIRAFLGNTPVVAHNANFDVSFMTKAYKNSGFTFNNTSLDTVKLAKKAFPNLPNYKLCTIKQYLHIETETEHRSLPDVYATAKVLVACAEEMNATEHFSQFVQTPRKQKKQRPKEYTANKPRFEHLKVKDLIPETTDFDTAHPLFDKSIVFTGEMQMSRKDAAQKAINVGALVKTGVSKKTNYLVVGTQDKAFVGDDGMSTKEEKAEELNSSGKSDIKVLSEIEYISLLNGVK